MQMQLEAEEASKQSELQGLLMSVAAARHEHQELQRQITRLKHEHDSHAQVCLDLNPGCRRSELPARQWQISLLNTQIEHC